MYTEKTLSYFLLEMQHKADAYAPSSGEKIFQPSVNI